MVLGAESSPGVSPWRWRWCCCPPPQGRAGGRRSPVWHPAACGDQDPAGGDDRDRAGGATAGAAARSCGSGGSHPDRGGDAERGAGQLHDLDLLQVRLGVRACRRGRPALPLRLRQPADHRVYWAPGEMVTAHSEVTVSATKDCSGAATCKRESGSGSAPLIVEPYPIYQAGGTIPVQEVEVLLVLTGNASLFDLRSFSVHTILERDIEWLAAQELVAEHAMKLISGPYGYAVFELMNAAQALGERRAATCAIPSAARDTNRGQASSLASASTSTGRTRCPAPPSRTRSASRSATLSPLPRPSPISPRARRNDPGDFRTRRIASSRGASWRRAPAGVALIGPDQREWSSTHATTAPAAAARVISAVPVHLQDGAGGRRLQRFRPRARDDAERPRLRRCRQPVVPRRRRLGRRRPGVVRLAPGDAECFDPSSPRPAAAGRSRRRRSARASP